MRVRRSLLVCVVLLVTTYSSSDDIFGQTTTVAQIGAKSDQRDVAPFNVAKFSKLFRTRGEAVRLKVLAEVERLYLDDDRLPEALEQIIKINLRKKQVTYSLLEAVSLFCRLENLDLLKRQLKFASSDDVRIAAVAINELAKRDVEGVLNLAIRLKKRREFEQSYGLRRIGVDAVAQYREPKSVEFLVQMMSQYHGQLRYETARYLAQLTGENFGGFPEKWQTWFGKTSEENMVVAARKAVPLTQQIPWPKPIPIFYGRPIFAYRVVFVIDRSKSMLSTADGETRIKEARRELESAVSNLPDGAMFNVLAYNQDVSAWQPGLVAADPVSKASAIRFATRVRPNGKTAVYDALAAALDQDPYLEAVYIVCDGKPTAGRIINRDEIVQAITAMNTLKRVSVNTIGIDTRDGEAQFLEKLAAQNFGKFEVIR